MRVVIQVVVTIMLSLMNTSYASAESPKEIELSNGEVVKVYLEKRSSGDRYVVTFENGHPYFSEMSGKMGYGLWSGELTAEEMWLADEAIDKYEQIHGKATTSSNSPRNPIGIPIILLGLFMAMFPYAAWYLEIGWKLQDAEPSKLSKLSLIANRVGGIFLSIMGLFVFVA